MKLDTDMSSVLPMPTADRLLRGVLTALGEMDLAGRPDLSHSIEMIRLIVGHLLARLDLAPYAALYSEMIALARSGVAGMLDGDVSQYIAKGLGALPDALTETDYDVAQLRIDAALAVLRDIVSLATVRGIAAGDPLLAGVEKLEERFYAMLPGAVLPAPAGIAPPLSRDAFEAYLLNRFPGDYAGLTSFRRLVGGFQKDTILIDAERVSGDNCAMVIRADKHDRIVRLTASDIADEYAIVRVMRDRGVLVADPLWLETDLCRFGRSFMVSARVAGGNAGNAVGSPERYSLELASSFVTTLAQLHGIELDEAVAATRLGRWLDHPSLAANTRAEIAAWRDQIWLRSAPSSPVFARAFDWLEANVPEDEEPPCIVHNDFGPHNILVDGDRVTAVLDWEVARIGDPAEDLANFLHCAGPAIDHDAAVRLYQELSGRTIGEFRLRYFDVLSIAKVFVATISSSTLYQKTEPALIDWVQMPLAWHAPFVGQIEKKIVAAERCRR